MTGSFSTVNVQYANMDDSSHRRSDSLMSAQYFVCARVSDMKTAALDHVINKVESGKRDIMVV